MLKAADTMGRKGVKIDGTPHGHGIARSCTVCFFDPPGNRNETLAGLGYLARPDRPPAIWTEGRLWRGIVYRIGEEAGTFTSVYI